ncbi:MAG: GNAT family N-acetyltransferase [Glaciecola sp.]
MTEILVQRQVLSLPEIAQIWQDIEHESTSFFLSWSWIGTWLLTLSQPLHVFVFYRTGNLQSPIGICIAGEISKSGFGIGYKQLYLNQSGKQPLDQAWIEYNDILANEQDIQACRNAWINHCFIHDKIDCVIINTSKIEARDWSDNGLFNTEQEIVQGFAKHLTPEFADLHSLLGSFSKNRRAQIKRALRYIESEYGNIVITQHTGIDALEHLHPLGELHKSRWGESDFGSGFDNPKFVEFHQQLLLLQHPKQDIHLLEFTAGKINLGYLYNFKSNGKVYFYLSGVNYVSADNKCKVGLVMHSLAMQYYARLNCNSYDFLGGESPYKTSLSDHQYRFYSTHLSRNSMTYQIKRSLHKVQTLLTKPA